MLFCGKCAEKYTKLQIQNINLTDKIVDKESIFEWQINELHRNGQKHKYNVLLCNSC